MSPGPVQMISITVPEDLRQSVLNELELIWTQCQSNGSGMAKRSGSSGAADRYYLIALGFLERNGDFYSLTRTGQDLITEYLRGK